MSPSTLDEQLDAYISDAASIEDQALAQLRRAPGIAGDEELARAFADHLEETEGHRDRMRGRLHARDASESRFKRFVMEAGGQGFVLFAASQPDTPGKLFAHAYSYEALEEASYALLERVARLAGDEETARDAREIRQEEHGMLQRLDGLIDHAIDAALAARDEDPEELVRTHLGDAHAIEQQSKGLLQTGPRIAGDDELATVMREHLAETEAHSEHLEDRLRDLGSSPSTLKDAAMRIGALNWSAFFAAQPDTPGKLAAFAYAFEHLEIAGYALLERVAARAGDDDTAALARRIADEERTAAQLLRGTFDSAVEHSLQAAGISG